MKQSNKPSLRSTIEQTLNKHCSSCWGDVCYYEDEGGGEGPDICCYHQEDQATNAILQAMREVVPEYKDTEDDDDDADIYVGFQRCRAEILKKLGDGE